MNIKLIETVEERLEAWAEGCDIARRQATDLNPRDNLVNEAANYRALIGMLKTARGEK